MNQNHGRARALLNVVKLSAVRADPGVIAPVLAGVNVRQRRDSLRKGRCAREHQRQRADGAHKFSTDLLIHRAPH